jgi:hypothetical protein
MSRLGSSLGQRSNASLTASAKSSRAYNPSFFPNFDKPALTMETSGLPSKPATPLNMPIIVCGGGLKTMQVMPLFAQLQHGCGNSACWFGYDFTTKKRKRFKLKRPIGCYAKN